MADGYRRKRWRDEHRIRIDLSGLTSQAVGDEGLSDQEIEALAPRLADVAGSLEQRRQGGALGFTELPHDRRALRPILALANEVRGEFDDVVVLGIGGSALGARALYRALKMPDHASAPPASGELRLHVADTIDPRAFGALLARLDLHRTVFNVISKSGETAETMAQFLVVRDRLLKELGAVEYARHIVVTTDATAGTLRQIVNDEGFRSLPTAANVPGRFSVLSAVGLFPAACAGIDVTELLAGAADMDERCSGADAAASPAYRHAGALHLAAERHGRHTIVMMPYSDALTGIGDWFCQLWAESLGKARDLGGAPVHTGQTPIRAVGPTDQHAQLQLWVEGPRDKVVVFVRVEEHEPEVTVPASYEDIESVAYLGGHGLGALMNIEQRGTELALAKAGRMTSTIICPRVNAFVLGQLLYLFELEVTITAALLGVDPFDQPGVEEGKQLTYGLAGRPGYEGKRAEVQRWLQQKEDRHDV
jgi:glucose-6-phosphate isomerase